MSLRIQVWESKIDCDNFHELGLGVTAMLPWIKSSITFCSLNDIGRDDLIASSGTVCFTNVYGLGEDVQNRTHVAFHPPAGPGCRSLEADIEANLLPEDEEVGIKHLYPLISVTDAGRYHFRS